MDHHGPSWTIMDHHGPSWTIMQQYINFKKKELGKCWIAIVDIARLLVRIYKHLSFRNDLHFILD
jgi:hypothetical protein